MLASSEQPYQRSRTGTGPGEEAAERLQFIYTAAPHVPSRDGLNTAATDNNASEAKQAEEDQEGRASLKTGRGATERLGTVAGVTSGPQSSPLRFSFFWRASLPSPECVVVAFSLTDLSAAESPPSDGLPADRHRGSALPAVAAFCRKGHA